MLLSDAAQLRAILDTKSSVFYCVFYCNKKHRELSNTADANPDANAPSVFSALVYSAKFLVGPSSFLQVSDSPKEVCVNVCTGSTP